jgi:hypothetical protein
MFTSYWKSNQKWSWYLCIFGSFFDIIYLLYIHCFSTRHQSIISAKPGTSIYTCSRPNQGFIIEYMVLGQTYIAIWTTGRYSVHRLYTWIEKSNFEIMVMLAIRLCCYWSLRTKWNLHLWYCMMQYSKVIFCDIFIE